MNRRGFLGTLLTAFAGATMIKSLGQLALAAPEPEFAISESTYAMWASAPYDAAGGVLTLEKMQKAIDLLRKNDEEWHGYFSY